ncbi:MAG: S8 family serine peptidase [Candidatus Ratteibacteria bacterium]
MRKIFFCFCLLVIIVSGKEKIEYKEGEIIVKFRNFTKDRIKTLISQKDLLILKEFKNLKNIYLLKTSKKIPEIIKELKFLPEVEYAEPNYIFKANLLPNDTYFNYQWGLNNTGQSINGVPGTYDADINAPEGWDMTQGDTSIVVAVIDTGVDYTHSDLIENMWRNPFEIQNGLDDDGNGYIDDIYGINAILGSGNPMDDNGHGTHVAGIIGAKGNNNNGVCGVNWKVSIMALKFLDSSGTGTLGDALECIDYIINMKNRGINIVSANNSWGGYGKSQVLTDAIENLMEKGVLFICASGNENTNIDYNPFLPGGTYLPNVITVSATDKNDQIASFSNYGKYKVDLGAPGVEIYSTFPSNNYYWASGTSMATPFVTGLSALVKSKFKNYDWIKTKNLILVGGKNLNSLSDKTITGKIIRADTSLSPSDKIVLSRLRPIGNKVSCSIEDGIDLSVLNIKNEKGNGNVNVEVGETGEIITLQDNGSGFDKFLGDGIYSNTYIPQIIGKYTLLFPNNDEVELYSFNKYNYQTTTYNWRDITATGTNLNFSDEGVKKINSPFPIKFGDYSGFTDIYIDANGIISLFDDITNYSFTYFPFAIPDSSINIQISPFRDDLNPSGNNNVYYAVIGNPPNRELVIEWRNVAHYPDVGNITFQVVFFENKSDIIFNYKDVEFGDSRYDKGANASIGIQISNKSGIQYSWLSPSLNNNLSILWKTEYTPPPTGIPNQPQNISPSNGSQNVSLTPTLIASDYSHPDNIPFSASYWQIRKQNSTYQNPVYNIETGPVTSISVPSGYLDFSTTYFWHVRYKDANGNWSLWSEETSFTTGPNRPPEKPTNISPSDNSEGISLTPTLIASRFSDPDGDILYLANWKIREYGKTEYWQTYNSRESLEVQNGVLQYSKKYLWSVRYSDIYGNWSDWSNETSFTTQSPPSTPPAKPYNILPYNGQENVDLNVLLIASGFSDPDGDIMANSYWQIREENGSYLNPYWENQNGGPVSSIYVDKKLKENRKYFWHVKYQDINGNWSDWSDETYFITKSFSSEVPSEGGGGGCFIASLCFGENSWQVKILKEFRDKILAKSIFGKKFIRFYYRVGPFVAEYLKRHYFLLIFVRTVLILFVILYILLEKFLIPVFFVLFFLLKYFDKKSNKRYNQTE